VSPYFSRALLVEGVLKGTDQSFRCLFVDNSPLKEYLLLKVYAEPPRTIRRWKIWIPALKKLIQNRPKGLDLCVAVLPLRYESLFQGLYDFKGQEYVRQVIDTSGSLDEIVSAFHQKKRQLTNKLKQKSGLTYRISHDLKDFDIFYHRMHQPHIQKKFGDLSHMDSLEEMKSWFLKGFLLLVLSGDQPIAGALCLVEGNALTFRRTGVLDGEESYIKMGAQLALYYFNILYAKDHGIEKVDTMKSRSILDDGVYRTKREWGAAVLPDNESESWVYFFNLGPSEKVARFFQQNPVIIHTETGLKGVVGVENELDLSPEVESDLTYRFYAPGLEGLILLTPESTIPIEVSFRKKEWKSQIKK
jgi:hypothetical protein